jgi:photosynthetic reaction center cytochrome c subunit
MSQVRKPQSRTPRSAKKILAISFIFVLSIATAIVAARAQSPAAPSQSSGGAAPLAEQRYKNIKVLKGIPADQVIPAMEFITASLGVECDFCHVRQERGLAFDKDDKKPKESARKMIEMMNAINTNNFEGKREVTCNSCHHGAAHPAGIPLVAVEGEKPPAMGDHDKQPDAAALPAADAVFEKYLTAAGGADAFKKITSRVEKGTTSGFGDQKLAIDIVAKAPNKRMSTMHMPPGDSVTAFDGTAGWMTVPGRPTHMMNAAESAGAGIDADFYLPVNAKSLRDSWKPAPGETIDGHATNVLVGQTDGQTPLRLYFDAQSGLLVRLVRYTETPLGRLPTQVDYADYRDADGAKIPYRWSISRPGNRFTIQVDSVQQNVSVDDAKFTPPPPPPPPPGQAPPAHP